MARAGLTFEGLRELAGKELGVSSWIIVDQDKINRFAGCTGDDQWIHVDVERTRRESPFRKPIAHGYLTLSLLGAMAMEIDALPQNAQAAFIHGMDRVRFTAPVLAGSRVRLRSSLVSLEDSGPRQYLMRTANIVEIEGDPRPALTAEVILLVFEKRRLRDA